MIPLQLQSALGLLALAALAWAAGGFRRPVPWRAVLAGLALQLALGATLLHIPPLRAAFALVGDAVDALARATRAGTSLVFGYLGGAPLPFAETAPGASFVLFFQALPIVLLVGALSALLYHWRVLPALVRLMSRALRAAFGISGACGVSVAANVFTGMVEATLFIRPWLASLSRSELLVVMTAGLATISGNMLVVYAAMLANAVPDAAGQLLAASLVSAPAAILVARLMLPGETTPESTDIEAPRLYDSAMDALTRGTADGLSLLLNIMAGLIVFVALVALANMALHPLTGLTLETVAGTLLLPLAWAMGIPPEDTAAAARLLGIRGVVNEFVAYLDMAGPAGADLAPRTRLILSWALCGFANFASVGIMVSGMGALCPERRADIVRLGLPALLAATIACCMTGATVGLLSP
ncbi:concentrative nucleoside transporter, CNT family [Roseomonas rosea]|uniref:Concentrative nucleoside transporter, CNT family n=1 Tax=Muricoccus roseus TaxID=198092 RepID=A0A1M6RUY6_9PROT|nr:nucleoside transporter C-terminal domain-containing protein [Roseomonas rosea]SHK36220.1 concentrative nucleoside transporter, CNT family [Roseomonas rosea]